MDNAISIIMQFINTFLSLILRKYLIITNVNKNSKMEKAKTYREGEVWLNDRNNWSFKKERH